ncbi:hypothetical protein [Leptospira koniambonensis]|uniref:hypothetical protein n=1 Tax=Leptospira koniambonensis TaxID=2484950 RepID=UPI003EBAC323
MNKIDWKNEIHKQLKKSDGYRHDGYTFHSGLARNLLDSVLGEKNIHSAVDYYLSGDFMADPIGGILRILGSEVAVDYCLKKLNSNIPNDSKLDILRLLKDISHPKALIAVEAFLFSEDPALEYQAAYLLDQLLFVGCLDEENYQPVLHKMKNHPNESVKEMYKLIRKSLRLRNSSFYRLLKYISDFFVDIVHKFEEIRLIGFRKSFSKDSLQEYLKAMAEDSKD